MSPTSSRPARVLLLNPPSPERLGAPLLGQQYVAASLLAAGHEVRVLDAAAKFANQDEAHLLGEIASWRPDVIGVALFSRWIWHAYRIVGRLQGLEATLVAGGAHATVRPEEALRQGFDVAVVGEAERTVVALVEALQGDGDLGSIPGLVFRDAGRVHRTPPAGLLADLDDLAPPWTAQHLYDPRDYDQTRDSVVPGGLLTSRGCPARCTFCANYVTGRKFRYRSAEGVIDELRQNHTRFGSAFFPFWDDALTAHKRRLLELCEAMERAELPLSWSAITRANHVSAELLAAMKRAGLVHVNFGVESGDDDILRQIKKGVNTDQVVRALTLSKEAGLKTAANFMLGFPQETPAALERTLRFMQRIAPLVDNFSTLGVVVPFPGTPLYEAHHERYGFTDWWLEERYAGFSAAPPFSEREAWRRHYIDDATLQLDFFGYDADRLALIREALRFKAEHNLARAGLLADPSPPPTPRPPGDRRPVLGTPRYGRRVAGLRRAV